MEHEGDTYLDCIASVRCGADLTCACVGQAHTTTGTRVAHYIPLIQKIKRFGK